MDNRHSIGATGDAEDEAVGRPEYFKRYGYLADSKVIDNHNAMAAARADALKAQAEMSLKSRSNTLIALDHLHEAMRAGASGDVLSLIVKAIKELEK